MAQQPRKFVEKMALLREKERQQSMAVEQVLREVRGVKDSIVMQSPYPRRTSGYYQPQQRVGYEQSYSHYANDFGHQVALQNQSRLSQSMPVLCSPPQHQAPQLDLQRALQEQREIAVAAVPANQRQRWPLRKAMSSDCRPDQPPGIVAPAPQLCLELPEQQCRRIKSEPDIHQSVKTSEDSMLRKRLTATATIPEDERAQQVHDAVYQRGQYVAQMSYPGNGYSLVSGIRASSVPDLSEIPIQQHSSLDQDPEQAYVSLPHSQASMGYIRSRRQGIITSPSIPLRKKSPGVFPRRSHPYYEVENPATSPMPPPPLYGPDQQNSYPPEYGTVTTSGNAQMSPPSSSVALMLSQQPNQQLAFQQQVGIDHVHPGHVSYADPSAEMQQTAFLQQKFNAMNVATSSDIYQHQQVVPESSNHPQIPGGFPGDRVIVTTHSHPSGISSNSSEQFHLQHPTNSSVSSGFSSPGYGMNYITQYNQVYSAGNVPALMVSGVACDLRQDSVQSLGQESNAVQVNSPFAQVPMSAASDGLVDALFAEPLDTSELKTLLNYGDSGLLPDSETEEALKRQP